MKVYVVTFVAGGLVSLMMVRSAVKSDREYTLSKFSAVADQLGNVSENAQINRYEYCNHD